MGFLSVLTLSLAPLLFGNLDIVEIKRPLDVEEAGQYFSPKCVIENTGQSTVIALVTCRIIDRWDMSQDYYDAMSSFPLDPGATTIEFDEFVPEGGKDYNAKFTVQAQSAGDSREKNFSASGEDVTPIEIIAPSGWPPFPPFEPTAIFAERTGKETEAVLLCEIEDYTALAAPAVLFVDSTWHTFAPHETLAVSFVQVDIRKITNFMITFWAINKEAENISHPPLVSHFHGGVEESGPGVMSKQNLDVILDGGKASIRFALAREGEVSLDVYDISGKRVAGVLDARLGAGEHDAAWNLEGVSRGVYFVRLAAGETVRVQKIVIGF